VQVAEKPQSAPIVTPTDNVDNAGFDLRWLWFLTAIPAIALLFLIFRALTKVGGIAISQVVSVAGEEQAAADISVDGKRFSRLKGLGGTIMLVPVTQARKLPVKSAKAKRKAPRTTHWVKL
jgi:hypothetical protein